MRRVEGEHQEEWAILCAAVAEPVQCEAGRDVERVSRVPRAVARGFVEGGIVVRPLPREDFVSVEASRLRLEVPFAEQRGLISRRLHQARKRDDGGMQRFGVGHRTVQVTVLAGEHGRARGPADGIRDEGIDEKHPGAGEAVEVRGAGEVRRISGISGRRRSRVQRGRRT